MIDRVNILPADFKQEAPINIKQKICSLSRTFFVLAHHWKINTINILTRINEMTQLSALPYGRSKGLFPFQEACHSELEPKASGNQPARFHSSGYTTLLSVIQQNLVLAIKFQQLWLLLVMEFIPFSFFWTWSIRLQKEHPCDPEGSCLISVQNTARKP